MSPCARSEVVVSHYENDFVPGYKHNSYVLMGHIRLIEAKKTKKKIRNSFHAQHFDFYFLQGEISEISIIPVQTVITYMFWQLFKVCKRLKYSSCSQLSNEYKNMGIWIIPCDPRVILRRSVWVLGNSWKFPFFARNTHHNLGFLEAFWSF